MAGNFQHAGQRSQPYKPQPRPQGTGNYQQRGNGQGQREKTPTTHYLMSYNPETKEKNLVQGVFITETEFGLKFNVTADAQLGAGMFFINKKKDKTAEKTQYNGAPRAKMAPPAPKRPAAPSQYLDNQEDEEAPSF